MSAPEQIYPSWRQSLAGSLHKNRSIPQAKFFQVANVDINGLPKNRTVVFRGFGQGNNNLLAISDRRSEKYTQWQQRAFAEICWYFDVSREQYRISCEVMLIDHLASDQSVRTSLWFSLSAKAKSQFFWPHPAEPYIDEQLEAYNSDEVSIDVTPPESFVGIIFEPNRVDYLNLRTHPQTREISTVVYSRNETTDQQQYRAEVTADYGTQSVWHSQLVNP